MMILQKVSVGIGSCQLFSPIDLKIPPGKIVGLHGRSGVGKSLLLRWILGALPAGVSGNGQVWLDGHDLTNTMTEDRGIGIMLQQPSLFPHLSVGSNIGLALKPGQKRDEQIAGLLDQAGLRGYTERDPATLSGGQQARVAMLRALAAEPKALLLDEPFSGLDLSLRKQFRQWVFTQVRGRNIPVLIVSHDIEDLAECDDLAELIPVEGVSDA